MKDEARTLRERLADDRSGGDPALLMATALLIGGVPGVWWGSAPGPWELRVALVGLVLLSVAAWVVVAAQPDEHAIRLYVPTLVLTGVLAAMVVAAVVAVRWAV